MKLSIKRFIKNRRGAILVEAAIVLPVLLLMLGTTAEFGRFFYTYNTLSKATRASARYVSAQPLNGSTIQAAQNLAVYGNVAGGGSPILSDLETGHILVSPTTGFPETITVSISGYAYQPIFAFGPLEGLINVAIDPSTTIKYLLNTPTV